MATYTYTIFDADPGVSGPTQWSDHEDVEVEADSDSEAAAHVSAILETEAAGLNPSDGYEVGQTIYALVWGDDGAVVRKLSYEITADDLGVRS